MRIIDRRGSRLIKDKGFLTVLLSQAEPFYERHDLVSHWKDIVLTSISSHFMTSIFRQATFTIYNRKDITLKGQDVRRGSYYSMWHDERGDHAASHSRKSKKCFAGASKAAWPNQKIDDTYLQRTVHIHFYLSSLLFFVEMESEWFW